MKNLFIVLLALGLVACGKEKDSDKVGNAQLCLDRLASNSTPAEVTECVSKADGVETSAAYGLRCAGSFMKEGFLNPNKIISAMRQLNGGSSGTVNFMTLITFTSTGAIASDTANSSTAFDYCLRGGGKGSTLLASFGFMAMSVYSFMRLKAIPNCSGTPLASGYDFQTCATSFATSNPGAVIALNDPSTVDAATITIQRSIGTVLIAASNISCTGTAANSSLCSTITASISEAGGVTADPRAIAVRFFLKLGL